MNLLTFTITTSVSYNHHCKRLQVPVLKQGVICHENSWKISSRFSLSAMNFHGS